MPFDGGGAIGVVMSTIFVMLALLAMAAVVFVLIRGLIYLMRGGQASKSNKMMQLRVLLQFLAVVLIVAALYFTGGGR